MADPYTRVPRRRPIDIQAGYLFENLKEGRQVAVALITGKFFTGIIRRFDRYVVIFLISEQEILVYKHAIESIAVHRR